MADFLDVNDPEFHRQFMEALPAAKKSPEGQHIYHHSDKDGCTFNIKVEKNSRGINWELTILGCRTADEARAKRDEALDVINELIEQERPF